MTDRQSLSVARITGPRLLGLALILAAGLAAFAGTSLVTAQRGGAGGPAAPDAYLGCVSPYTGVLRIIDAGQQCAAQESAIQIGGSASDTALQERIEDLEATNTDLQGMVNSLLTDNQNQQTQIDGLEASAITLPDCLTTEAVDDQARDDIVFEGCNVHVRSGSGATDGPVNGLGNLIIGYNEVDTAFGLVDDRTGSHNLVIGGQHTYSSYGGLVAGYNNAVSGWYSSVTAGKSNTASGNFSSVSGGDLNTASEYDASVSGGTNNTASGEDSSVSGGTRNTASGDFSSISGGFDNAATGNDSSVLGGYHNTAEGRQSSIGGGSDQTTTTTNQVLP